MTCALVENDSCSKIPVVSGLLVDGKRTDTRDRTPPFVPASTPVETRVLPGRTRVPGAHPALTAIAMLCRRTIVPFEFLPAPLNNTKSFIASDEPFSDGILPIRKNHSSVPASVPLA